MRTKLIAATVAGGALIASVATGVGLGPASAAGGKAKARAAHAGLAQEHRAHAQGRPAVALVTPDQPAKGTKQKKHKAKGQVAQGRPAASSCTRTNDRIRVVTLNVKSNPTMSADKVRSDIHRAAGLGADVIMWQEIQPDYYKRILRAERITAPGKGQWVHLQTGYEVPISVRVGGDSPWVVEGQGARKMHDGKAKVSPNRYVTWVRLYNKKSHQTTVFANTHMVSGAWNGRPNPADAWRKRMWNVHFDTQRDLMQDFVRRGYTVVYGGDLNRAAMPSFGANDRPITLHGIDHLGLLRAPDDRVEELVERTTIGGFHSDHDAKRVRIVVSGCRPA